MVKRTWEFARRLIVLASLSLPLLADSETRNGFLITHSVIPKEMILAGGPPKDGIPAIDRPHFVLADGADHLRDGDRVVGVYRQGIAKAYPIAILNWHEIVNDRFGDERVVVSFCPLCGTAMVFSAQAGGEHSFGVSGLLYNSDVLMYDRETESLWSQLLQKAVAGPLVGTPLMLLPASHTSWQQWRDEHPDSLVLSRDTGFRRDYDRNPYQGYEKQRGLFFEVANESEQFHPKESVLGITLNGQHKAYPFSELSKQGLDRFEDQFNGETLTIEWSLQHSAARVMDKNGQELPSVIAFWFAWYGFYPETEVFLLKSE